MTIKEIKVKIEALETALRFPALPNNNAILQEVLKNTLLELQADLINELEATKGGTQFAVRNAQGKATKQGEMPETNKQDLPWDWDSRDSMTDEEREKALNNIG